MLKQKRLYENNAKKQLLMKLKSSVLRPVSDDENGNCVIRVCLAQNFRRGGSRRVAPNEHFEDV